MSALKEVAAKAADTIAAVRSNRGIDLISIAARACS